MKGDFSRATFDPKHHYTGVRMQQGRVQLDSDWNEQVDILRYALTTQFKDLIGAGGAPAGDAGFEIALRDEVEEESTEAEAAQKKRKKRLPDFEIGRGRYYVDGILCENEATTPFTRQPDYPGAGSIDFPEEADRFFIYLDVWQRHLTSIEAPSIREVALGGTDTTTRTQTIWQVKLFPLVEEPDREEDEEREDDGDEDGPRNEDSSRREDSHHDNDHEKAEHHHDVDHQDDEGHRGEHRDRISRAWEAFVEAQMATAHLQVRQTMPYAGLGNQLYRVEIHAVESKQPGFKWSRENGTVAFPITGFQPGADPSHRVVTLAYLERDPLVLKTGDWVELANDESELNGTALPLCQVLSVNAHQGQVVIQASGELPDSSLAKSEGHPLLRRWDQDQAANGALVDGMVPIVEGRWLPLEYGIEVSFSKGGRFQPGDYWQIPARSMTGEIEWPHAGPAAPLGVEHHFAPLAVLAWEDGKWRALHDLRHVFVPAPVVESEDLDIFKQLHSERSFLSKLEGVVADLMEDLEAIKKDTTRGGAYLSVAYRSVYPLEEGDVVALNPEEKEQVVPANRENEALVVGVVGKRLGETRHGEFRLRVVTYGKTTVKVMGKIRPGDLLSPSETDACASKANHPARPGTIVGKALERFKSEDGDEDEDDIGRIEMFVTIS